MFPPPAMERNKAGPWLSSYLSRFLAGSQDSWRLAGRSFYRGRVMYQQTVNVYVTYYLVAYLQINKWLFFFMWKSRWMCLKYFTLLYTNLRFSLDLTQPCLTTLIWCHTEYGHVEKMELFILWNQSQTCENTGLNQFIRNTNKLIKQAQFHFNYNL